jgi:hypothetical protein
VGPRLRSVLRFLSAAEASRLGDLLQEVGLSLGVVAPGVAGSKVQKNQSRAALIAESRCSPRALETAELETGPALTPEAKRWLTFAVCWTEVGRPQESEAEL